MVVAVVVDEHDLHLAAVARVDSARRIDDGQSVPRGQARARVDQCDVAVRQRDRDPGRHEGTFARSEVDIDGGVQVRTRVTGMGVRRQREVGVEALDRDLEVTGSVVGGLRGWHEGAIYRLSFVDYAERLSVPLRWWVQGTMLVASFWLAVLAAVPPELEYIAWTTTGAALLLMAAAFLSYGSARIAVDASQLRAGNAQIPLEFVGDVRALDTEEMRLTAGRDADARALLVLRPYLKRGVRIEITDPADPTPYWLVSCRHPDQVVKAVEASRVG